MSIVFCLSILLNVASSLPARADSNCDKTIDDRVPAASRFDGTADGDTICLEDGQYRGGLRVPDNRTVVGLNRGKAVFSGGDRPWSAIVLLDGQNSTVDGLKVFRPDNANSNACKVSGKNNVMKNTSCSHGGRYKHSIPLLVSGTGHLIEDSWFYGEGRYVVLCFKGDNIRIRRNVARWDSTMPDRPSEPNAAFSIYNCSDMTVENNISLDYGIPETPMKYGGNFYSPQNREVYPKGNQNNWYLGNIAVNHSVTTGRKINNNRGIRIDHATPTVGNVIDDFYLRDIAVGFVISARSNGVKIGRCTLRNVARIGAMGFEGKQSKLSCSGEADIRHRWQDRKKTNIPLFPLENEQLIKADMCAAGERQSDWCLSGLDLYHYITR